MAKRKKKTIDDHFRHSVKRAAQRYSLFLTKDLYNTFIKNIQTNKAFCLGKESNSKSHWLINDMYIVIYDRERKSIVTFLPPDAIHNYLPLQKNGRPAPLIVRDTEY